jgi:hypothetical protein
MTLSESAVDRDLIVAVLDRLIPAEAGFPSGGTIAFDHLRQALGQQTAITPLLDAIEQAGRSNGADGFVALPAAEQIGVLRRLEAEQPAAFEALVIQAYWGYYSHPTVLERLGLDPTPPQPRGHVLEPFDERILDTVRQRGPIYRTP